MTDDLKPIRRNASTPTAGAARGTIKGTLAGIATVIVAQKTGSPEAGAAAAAFVTGLLSWLGKIIREQGADAPWSVQVLGEFL